MTVTVGAEQWSASYAYDALDRLCVISTRSTPTACADTQGMYAFIYQDTVADPAISWRETLTYPDGLVETAAFDPFGERIPQQTGAVGRRSAKRKAEEWFDQFTLPW